jgi:hypothetical protein
VPNRIAKYQVLVQLCGCLVRRDVDKSERVEGQEFLHTADGPKRYLCLPTEISAEKSLEIFISPNSFQNCELGKRINVDKLM